MKKNPCQKKTPGFALVVTILLMVLLAIITVGTLSLSAVTLRSSGQDASLNIARANARMALMIAIGELQRHTGSDTRVTATANIVDENYPQVLGVWRSWEGTNHAANGRPIAPPYNTKNQPQTSGGRFVDWLVSSADDNNTPSITDPPNLVRTSPSADTIPLLAEGSLVANDPRQIHLVPTLLNDDTDPEDDGRFAWWISGENQKALLSQPYQPRNEDVSALAEMGQSHSISDPSVFGLPALINDPELHNPGLAPAKAGRKAISRKTMDLIDVNNTTEPHKKFHDLSSYSIGLLTNTATGGWRKDLSILTERWDAIYAGYPGARLPLFRYTPTSGATSQVPKPLAPANTVPTTNVPAITAATPAESNLYPWSNYSIILGNAYLPNTYNAASASWQSLVSFATAYKNFTLNSGVVESPFVWDIVTTNSGSSPAPLPPPANTNSVRALQVYNYKHTQRLYPQIARFQYIIYAKATQTSAAPLRYRIDLMYCPVFTLWNPYDLALKLDVPANPTVSAWGFGWRRALPGALAVVNKATYPIAANVPLDQYRLVSNGNMQYIDVGGNYGNETDEYLNYNRYITPPIQKYSWAAGLPNPRCRTWTDMRSVMCSLPPGTLTFKPGEAKVFSPNGTAVAGFGGVGIALKEGYDPTSINGTQINNIAANLTPAQSFWFLYSTDKATQPYRNRNPGLGFALTFGRNTGPTYLNMALHSGTSFEYHNLTSLAEPTIGNQYWPKDSVSEIGYTVAELASGPWIPLFSFSFGPRATIGMGTGTPQNRPTKGVLQSNPLASMAMVNPVAGDPKAHPANGTFDLAYHSLSMGSTLTPNLSTSKGFIATGYQSGDGLSRLIASDIPLRPMASLGELIGWNPRGNNPYPPFQHNLIGNSDATPLIPSNQVVPTVMDPNNVATNLMHDDAYCANHLLFDDWFVSSIAPKPYSFGGDIEKDINAVYREYLKGESRLTNRAYLPISADSNITDTEATARITQIINSNNGWLKVASRFEVEGMFNVNTTSVEAWKALLGRAKSLEQIAMQGANEVVSQNVSNKHVVTRGPIAPDIEAGTGSGFSGQFNNASEYAGFRNLSDAQIEDLAEKVVEQIRLRGPFLSLSEFVNRQLSNNENLALAGAIQTAINNLAQDPMAKLRDPANALSDNTMPTTDPKLTGVNYAFSKAAEGSSAYGAPGWIRQADILRPIAPVLSVRDDTFTVRAYGDALDKKGNVIAQAWCEAVVKRTRDFSDQSDAADAIDPPTVARNITFGRKYEIVSFRWLNSDEV